MLQSKIHYYCANGVIKFCNGIEVFEKENYKEAFLLCGDSAVLFDKANEEMRNSENGVWQGFYHNDCLADIKHTAYMARKVMGLSESSAIISDMTNGIAKRCMRPRTERLCCYWYWIII